ncbi:hypothetical protein D3C79_469700 [compost metagenome]
MGLVVGLQLVKAGVQVAERPLVGRQHQYAVGQAAQVLQRGQPVAQRIGFGLGGMDADRGCDARQHLVAGNQQAVFGGVQAGVLRGMATPDQHLPLAIAEGQPIALAQALVAVEMQRSEMTALDQRVQLARLLLAKARFLIEIHEIPARRWSGGHGHIQRAVLVCRHVHRAAEALGQPAGDARVVGVVVGADHRQQRLAGKQLGEHALPDLAGLRGVHAGVDHYPAVAMAQQVQVDVVQAKRQRHAQPPYAGSHFTHLAAARRLWPWVTQAALQFMAVAIALSHGGHPRTRAGQLAPGPGTNTADRSGWPRRVRTADRRTPRGNSLGAADRPCAA